MVLIVEDDSEMRSLLRDELWGEGYVLKEARDGEEAVRVARESPPDLILSDLKMPGGGVEYVSRLKRAVPNCPLVLMTAFGDAKLQAEVLASGATAYFDKPVHVSELKATIKRLLNNKAEGERQGASAN
ncbi:MAG: response regulator [Nitrospira sp.]|nr:response regulator [Nitrospira sp.]